MTTQNRAQSPPALPLALAPWAVSAPCYILVPFPGLALPSFPPFAMPAAALPAVKEAPKEKETPTPSTPAPKIFGAGLPAPLLTLMRTEEGPFLANEVFSVAPSQPLAAIEEAVPAAEWYAITRGRFVGVVDQFALSAVAISGVAHNANKAYATQALALDAFNKALTWGGVQVV
ncbi:hypothetical protein C8F04DRAFT_1182927 [Mycena alexandri]|uniref:Uncharacterized protein n=1 Tax=Mycena alexandri TaxID=1745969 RepID=A0AAD6SVL4_9AGAR|nr:hypothetical protein C8F04DRAFT_1182927 [Mycena alexandri]